MCRPLVTVVIPIYNVEDYLDRCIESVVCQTYDNIEIILVDDGSPDRCPQICDDWSKKDSRIKVIHKSNGGLGFARNSGIENASGKYIFFFDSDDYVSQDIVEKCVYSAEENGSDAVLFGVYDVDQSGVVKSRKVSCYSDLFLGDEISDDLLPKMLTYDYGVGISAWGKMYRMSVITHNNILFKSERDVISEDAMFALEFYPKTNKVSIVEDSLYYYCKRGDSLSCIYNPQRQDKNDLFLQKSLEYIDETGLSKTVKNHLVVRYHMYTIAAIEHLMVADLSKSQKKAELKKILKSYVLKNSLKSDIIAIHKTSLKIFFTFLKAKLYFFCYLLVFIKARK